MMTPERWQYTSRYLREIFGAEDQHLAGLMAEAKSRGMPDIAVSADVGRFLYLLTKLTQAMRALEIGTLAGYSAIWIARALAPGGELITIEREASYADFAEAQFERAGVRGAIELRRGQALDLLPALAQALGPQSLDFVFADAEKTEYPDYWHHVRPLLRPGGLFVADNVLGSSKWWIDDEQHPARIAADRLNRIVSADPDFDASAVPLREGLLIARRR